MLNFKDSFFTPLIISFFLLKDHAFQARVHDVYITKKAKFFNKNLSILMFMFNYIYSAKSSLLPTRHFLHLI